MDYNKFMCGKVSINVMPSGMGERDDILSQEVLENGFSSICRYGIQKANLFLGNPGDTDYVDEMVPGIYIGTTITRFSIRHTWLYYDHNGRLCICETCNSDDNGYDYASRTTFARSIRHWNKKVVEKAQELLGYAGIRPVTRKAA